MLKNLKSNLSLATVTAIFVMSGLARADGGDYLLPVAYIPDDVKSEPAEPTSCKALRDAAWFLAEMERSDGQVSPSVPAVNCSREIFADSSAAETE